MFQWNNATSSQHLRFCWALLFLTAVCVQHSARKNFFFQRSLIIYKVDEGAMLVTRASDISKFSHLRGPSLLPEEKKTKALLNNSLEPKDHKMVTHQLQPRLLFGPTNQSTFWNICQNFESKGLHTNTQISGISLKIRKSKSAFLDGNHQLEVNRSVPFGVSTL